MLEVALVLLVLAALFGAYSVIHAVKPFIVNAAVGLVAILVAQALGVQVVVSPLVLLLVALGGLPGAILVVSLATLDVAFAPGLLAGPTAV